MLVAYEVNVLDAHFFSAVDVEIHADGVLDYSVFLRFCRDGSVKEALFDILGEFAAPAQVQALLQLFLVAALDAGERPARDPGPLLDNYFEICRVGSFSQMVDDQRYVFKIALQPQPAHHSRHVVAGNGKFHALLEAGELNDLLRAEIAVALNRHATHKILLGVVIIYFHIAFLRPEGQAGEQDRNQDNNIFVSHLFSFR